MHTPQTVSPFFYLSTATFAAEGRSESDAHVESPSRLRVPIDVHRQAASSGLIALIGDRPVEATSPEANRVATGEIRSARDAGVNTPPLVDPRKILTVLLAPIGRMK